MDFSFSEEQEAVAEAAAAIFDGQATVDRVREVEATDDRIDQELWTELAKANLLGIAVPEAHGGSGLGIIELALLLQAQGRTVAPIPLWAVTCLGALPVARYGTDEQQAAWLPGVVSGDVILTAALEQLGSAAPTEVQGVAATPDGDGWTLTGRRLSVPAGHVATRILVPATTPDGGVIVALVDPAGAGVTVERAATTDRSVRAHVTLESAPVAAGDVLGDASNGAEIVRFAVQHGQVGLAAQQLGIGEAALAQTAEYVSNRKQFERPLSTNQGVAMRAGDAYIDLAAMRTTLWQAAWRLSEGLPADQEVLVAKFWAAEGGHRVVHTTQHLHGGMGADVDYPIHRYFLWAMENGATLGSGTRQLVALGEAIAAEAKANAAKGAAA
jgi:alkylation response protein AidB-like acyl-CoA dehydrogenase